MLFRTTVDDIIHWPCQNYEKDCMANIHGFKCGCGREWCKDYHLHDMVDCSWNKCTGDVISSEYSHVTNHQLNTIRSYCDLAVQETCRCIPSMSILKHGNFKSRHSKYFRHPMNGGVCSWSLAICNSHCSSCVHYCGIQHGP